LHNGTTTTTTTTVSATIRTWKCIRKGTGFCGTALCSGETERVNHKAGYDHTQLRIYGVYGVFLAAEIPICTENNIQGACKWFWPALIVQKHTHCGGLVLRSGQTHTHTHTNTHIYIHIRIHTYVYIHLFLTVSFLLQIPYRHTTVCICTYFHTYKNMYTLHVWFWPNITCIEQGI
jgi:hypothetical protein